MFAMMLTMMVMVTLMNDADRMSWHDVDRSMWLPNAVKLNPIQDWPVYSYLVAVHVY